MPSHMLAGSKLEQGTISTPAARTETHRGDDAAVRNVVARQQLALLHQLLRGVEGGLEQGGVHVRAGLAHLRR